MVYKVNSYKQTIFFYLKLFINLLLISTDSMAAKTDYEKGLSLCQTDKRNMLFLTLIQT